MEIKVTCTHPPSLLSTFLVLVQSNMLHTGLREQYELFGVDLISCEWYPLLVFLILKPPFLLMSVWDGTRRASQRPGLILRPHP